MLKKHLKRNERKYLLVTIDVEEDNWGYIRGKTTSDNIRSLYLVQDIFDKHGIRPIYLCTYPVINDEISYEILKELFIGNKCDIGVHLHPWNTPPLFETNNDHNSFLNNLNNNLIVSKLETITSRIHELFGIHPRIFRSGRWGFGENVARAIIQCGYTIDVSVTPFISWEKYGGGPSFINYPYIPHFLRLNSHPNSQNILLEVPVSIGFNRSHFYLWNRIHALIDQIGYNNIRLSGIFSKTNLLKKIWLNPELDSLKDMVALSDKYFQKGMNLLHLSFHSTSLKPGCSPFVKTEEDLKDFLKRIDLYFYYISSQYDIISIGVSNAVNLIQDRAIKSDLLNKELW